MAWQTVTDVNDGQTFDGDAWQTAIDAVDELQDQLVDPADTGLQSFTPMWANVTVGDATVVGRAFYGAAGSQRLLRVFIEFTFGTTTAFTGAVSFTIPFSETAIENVRALGTLNARDGTGDLTGHCSTIADTTDVVLFAGGNNINTAVPHTWTTGDSLQLDITVPIQ